MPTLPRVSIITPSFNQVAFIEQTIRSVLDQDYPNLEYWVIDGGSSDGSLEIIRKYAGQLAGWVSEPDRGQSEGINKGLARATGDVVAWLNSDDLYYPGAVQAAVAALAANPQASFVFSDVESIDEAGQPFHRMHYGHWGLADLMRFRIIGQPAVFMRHTFLAQTGLLDPSYHYLLDHHLWLRMAMKSQPQYIPQLWAGEHYHAGSKNAAHAAEFGKEARRILEWMRSQPELADRFNKNRRQIEAGAERLNAFYLFDAQDYKAALRAYWRSFWNQPATALQDWRRILYAMVFPLGVTKTREAYLQRRKQTRQWGVPVATAPRL